MFDKSDSNCSTQENMIASAISRSTYNIVLDSNTTATLLVLNIEYRVSHLRSINWGRCMSVVEALIVYGWTILQ